MTSESITIADINQLLETFDKFVNMCESSDWLKDVTVEVIKTIFKLALFVEEAIRKFETKNCISEFKNLLDFWWQTKDRFKVYDVKYFGIACDHVLTKFFTTNINVNMLDVAVRMYTSMLSKHRLESVLVSLILKSASFDAILDYTISNKNVINLRELECRLLLRAWSNDVQCGARVKVQSAVLNMLMPFKIHISLPSLICMLSLNDVSQQENDVKKLVLENILSKMKDRSILSKQFWLNIFRTVDKKSLAIVCVDYSDFLKELFDFIIYIGCMMNYEIYSATEFKWKGDSCCICPDLTYNDLASLIKFLCNYNENIRKYTKSKILVIEYNIQLWKQLDAEICL